MTNHENPFTIAFGKEPYSIISRENELNEIYSSFSSSMPESDVYILTGIRGSGKTVAMAKISDFYKKEDDWIVVELNPISDMLEQLASKLFDEGKLKKLFLKTEFSFSFKGFGFSISGKDPISNVSTLLSKELEYLSKKNYKVLITIDEAISNENMKIFVHEYQLFLRNKYPVRLLMTGLYQNISILQQDKSLTFLYRAPKIYLGALNLRAIANSYKNIFSISELESVKLAKLTNGYAFAYQLLGSILFKQNKTKADSFVIDEFDEILAERSYNVIYSEITKKEKELIKAAAIDNRNGYLIESLKISKSQLSNYKKILMMKGIINSNKRNVEFALPRFKEFINFVREIEE